MSYIDETRDPAQHAGLDRQEPASKPRLSRSAKKDVALYAVARLGLFLVLTVIIHSVVIFLGMAQYFPVMMSALLALIIALPLSMFLFKNLRLRTTEQIAQWDSGRRAHKQQMRMQLQERLDD